MAYKLTDKCPEIAYVQHLPSGDFDYSEYTFEGAVKAATDEWFPQSNDIKSIGDDGVEVKHTLESAQAETEKTISVYKREEILEEARGGCGWPVNLGFVEEVEG
jgi:hypothetical protein